MNENQDVRNSDILSNNLGNNRSANEVTKSVFNDLMEMEKGNPYWIKQRDEISKKAYEWFMGL